MDLNRRRRHLSPQTAISCPTRVSRAVRNRRSNPNPYPPSTHGSGRWTPYGRTSEADTRVRPRKKAFMLHEKLSRVGSASQQSRRKKHETWVTQKDGRQRVIPYKRYLVISVRLVMTFGNQYNSRYMRHPFFSSQNSGQDPTRATPTLSHPLPLASIDAAFFFFLTR